jgi:ElaB/YqjD/DUF883 family membrane-anchored ribosome-binding protein
MTVQSNIKANSAVNNLKQAGHDAKSAATSEADDYTARLTNVANKVGQEVGTYVEQASEYFNDATARVKNAGSNIEAQIESNPLRSSLIALGAGVILGMLMRK